MLGIRDFWLFVAAGLVLNVTPGPDTFYILGRSVSQGRAGDCHSLRKDERASQAMAAKGHQTPLHVDDYEIPSLRRV